MIHPLDWDTDFFGYAVGQTENNFEDENTKARFLKEAKNFRLLYIVSEKEINPVIKGSYLVCIKTRLSQEIVSDEDNFNLPFCEYDGVNHQQLKALALESGTYSRFNVDPNFTNHEFEKLYLKWIADSIEKKVADHVIVYKQDPDKCRGFVTLKFKEHFSEIGLIAVDKLSRGKGVGLGLLKYVNNLTRQKGLKKIVVSTQFENEPAMKLYEKAGYKIISKKYIYHLWN